MAQDTTRLLVLPFLQQWDASSSRLSIRLLLIPRDSFIEPHATNNPTSPAFFPNVTFKFKIHVSTGLRDYPVLGTGEVVQSITLENRASYATVFSKLATTFGNVINKNPSADKRARNANPGRIAVRKHLPVSYRDAVRYTPDGSDLFSTDETYSCSMKKVEPKRFYKPPEKPFAPSWGELIASILRIPDFAALAGFIRTCDIEIPASDIKEGAYVWFELENETATTIAISDSARMRTFAARILPLNASSSLFSATLFAVEKTATIVPLDTVLKETDDYFDGWAKAVHGMQPTNGTYLTERPNNDRPSKDIGIRLGWDDEQVTIWADRLIDPMKQQYDDFPFGVRGYRVDVREAGTVPWYSLSRAEGSFGISEAPLGTVTSELGVEVHPVKSLLGVDDKKEYWLPMYFVNWTQSSLVGIDETASLILGRPRDTRQTANRGSTDPALQLRYGRTYQFRVRLMDQTGGGPLLGSASSTLGPSPSPTVAFARWIKPLALVLVGQMPSLRDEPGADNSIQVQRFELKRPPLTYPAIVYTGYPNALEELKTQAEAIAQLPDDPTLSVTEPNLPDPDADRVEITVLIQTAPQDPLAKDGPYMELYTTTRAFPSDVKASISFGVEWRDMADIRTPPVPWNAAATTGPLLLPTARTIRLRINALCRDEPNPDKPYFGADDVRRGPQLMIPLRKNPASEANLFVANPPSYTITGFFLQPQLDTTSRLAEAIGIRSIDTKLRALPGKRVVFACSSSLLHLVGPDRGSLSFTSHSDLALRWIVVIRLNLLRDWSWDGFPLDGVQVQRDGKFLVSVAPVQALNEDALSGLPDRSKSHIVIVDVIEPRLNAEGKPIEINLDYTVITTFSGLSAPTSDPPIALHIRLPVTTAPTQVPQLASVGLAMSPYVRDANYSSTSPRKKVLWLEFASPIGDDFTRYVARVLKSAPDPLLIVRRSAPNNTFMAASFIDTAFGAPGAPDSEAPEPPIPLDPELIRRIVPDQSTDFAGSDAMQQLIPTSSPLHWGLPLPAGITEASVELFGFWTYEFRVGRADDTWCTAQARYGPPLRVTGIQHPAPQLACSMNRNHVRISVSAPFAKPIVSGKISVGYEPSTEIWFLLYAQAAQIDGGTEKRNILVGRVKGVATRSRKFAHFEANAEFVRKDVNVVLGMYGLKTNTSLSAMAVELFGQQDKVTDPLGGDLGRQRILRTSCLVPVPAMC
ncbi:hypothetical protein CC86DRAFT_10768 [Ophiobolus disseminans]|uniref:Uncharacterized protein n=1 Tax=Ophiobolus disseminans TaxID=1469910 RepID=A0A6A7ALF8_9PLEO|nr:hypothetical protein CC86DRAFT_10768 [Ophiobolus disseminans]